jgi:hypothetical protein
MRIGVTLALALALGLAACQGDDSGSSTETAAVQPSTTETQTETVGTSETGEVTTTAPEPPCAPGDFLPVLRRAFDGQAPKLRIVKARVERCRNGYAQVFAVPDRSVCEPSVGFCYETEQVFLRWTGDRWRILTSGTGIACGAGIETDALVLRICRGLGYPDLTTREFQMPSRNIGCLLAGGELRCDILSGLEPEPTTACEFDWVGVVLSKDSAGPNCGSDTVYMKAAPTLAYGGEWRRGGFTCHSSETGLNCFSGTGHGFKLARESWAAS